MYYPEIDGIRFLAIVTMIIFHACGYFYVKFDPAIVQQAGQFPLLGKFIASGQRGVQYFFVLSGFILCLPFARYYLAGGPEVSLKRYYLRRLTRLEPPYFIAMILLFIALLAMKLYTFDFLFPSLMASLIYAHGFIYQHVPYVTVIAWSLEVEVQFYLIAPLLFTVLALSPVLRRLILVAVSILFIVLQHIYGPGYMNLFYQIQYFLVGILLADLYVNNVGNNILKKNWVIPVSLALMVTMFYLPIYTSLTAVLVFPFVVLLFYCTVLRNPVVKSVFSYKWIPVLGGMCYSVYLLHYPVISFIGRFTTSIKITDIYMVNLLVQLGLMMVSIFVISSVFYYFIERPFMSSHWTNLLMEKWRRKDPLQHVDEKRTELAEPNTLK